MSKDEFLNLLDRKLQVINEKERRDIIDEYRTHIEMKIADGKSEEEVIDDFGNVDELVDEILDAYKINTDRVNQSFDHKLNNFMDDMYNGFKRFIGSFTSLEVDDVVKLIFEIIVILIILAVLHIPFYIVEWLGTSILRNIIGLGIGHVLGTIWRVVVELAYVVVVIVTIVNVISKRINRYRHPEEFDHESSVFDDFKNTFNFDGKRTNGNRTTYTHTNKNYDQRYAKEDFQKKTEDKKQDVYADVSDDMSQEDMETEEFVYKDRKEYQTYDDRMRQKNPRTSDMEGSVSRVMHTLMRIFFVLMCIPFIFVIVGLCCLLGAMVVFSIQGFTLFGAYFLVVGGILVTSAFLSLLKTALWGRR